MKKLKMLIKVIAQFVLAPPPVTKKPILLFNAFWGQYTCNPKYILLKLHEKAPSLKVYFLISEKHSAADPLPEFVVGVGLRSIKYFILLCRCNIHVTNDVYGTNDSCIPFEDSYKALLKQKKLIVSTWHGSGALKKCYADGVRSQHNGIKSFEREVLGDFFLAGTRTNQAIYSTFVNHDKPFPVSLTGSPRCDILVNGDADVAALKEKLRLPKDKKVLLFAPTFRSYIDSEGKDVNVYDSGVHQLEVLDIPRLLQAVQMRFGGDWAFVLRVHPAVVVEMRKRRAELPAVIDGNRGDDMMEYLTCADVLLTDYSSSMTDFALTRKPCFLFALDREHYENEERGFYSDFDALPFPFADTPDGLLANIRAFDEAAYTAGVDAMLAELGCAEDGRASERVADCILHYIKTGEKRLETVDGVDVRDSELRA